MDSTSPPGAYPITPDSSTSTGSSSRKRSYESMNETSSSSQRAAPSGGFKVVDVPDLPESLDIPPLPPIKNRAIQDKVFTHPSVTSAVRKRVKYMEDEEELKDNEKLEWVGDGLLKAICTRLLQRLWPKLAEGPSTTILSHVVSNTTLANLTRRYGLMKRLRVAAASRMSIETSEKNQANLFEAYIAGVFESILDPDPKPDLATSNGNVSHTPPSVMVKAEAGLDFALPSPSGLPARKTEGQAYDELSDWLVPLLTPIAHFVRDHLHSERHRITQSGNNDDGDDDSHIDPAAVTGSTARLNELFIGRLGLSIPDYQSAQTEGLLWRTKCTATLKDGRQVVAETVQTGKKPGMQVAAYKVLRQMGLVKDDDMGL